MNNLQDFVLHYSFGGKVIYQDMTGYILKFYLE